MNKNAIPILILMILLTLAGFFAGKSRPDGPNPLQYEVDSLKWYSSIQEQVYNKIVDSVTRENQYLQKLNDRTEQFIISTLKQIKKTNEKFNNNYVSVPLYVDSVRANGGFR